MSILISRQPSAARFAILSLAVVGVASQAFAASATYLQAAPDGNFANGLNWDTGVAPGAVGTTTNTDTATFGRNTAGTNSTVIVDANRNLQNITLNPTLAGSTTFGYAFTGGPIVLTAGGAITAGGTGLASSSFATPINLQGDGTISADFASTNRLLTVSGAVTGTAATGVTNLLTLTGGSGGTHVVSGVIGNGANGGLLGVVKSGANTWQLTNTNTYTGGTTLLGGTLVSSTATPNTNIGTGAVTFGGGTLRLSATSSTLINPVVVGAAGGSISTKGATLSQASTTGTGTLNLLADAGSTVTPSNNSFGGFSGTVAVGGGFTFRLGTNLTNFDATNAFAAATLNLTAATTVVNRGFATNVTQTVNIGTLAGVAGSVLTGGSVAGNGTFFYSVGARNEGSTFAGNLTNGLTKTGLAKVGTGALALTGTNTFTGGTTIVGGSIVTGSTSALGAGTVGVTGGTLTVGNGTVNTVGGLAGLTMADATTLELVAVQAPTVGNVALASGVFTLGNINLDLNNLYGTAGSYVIVDGVDGANAIGTTTFIDPSAGFTYAFNVVGNDGVLTVSAATAAVPEPATLAVLGLASTLGLMRRRKA